MGNASITYAGIQVGWTTSSDRNLKSDITNTELGLDFINKLNPVSYYRKNDESKKIEYGFIAQEVEEILIDEGINNTGIVSKNSDGIYNLRYNDFISILSQGIKELKNIAEIQEEKIKELEKKFLE